MTVNPENKTEQVQMQAQSIPQTNEVKPEVAKTEAAPVIKSEENQTNWKAFREQREKERKAREDAEKRMAEKAAEAEALRLALEAAVNKPSHNRQTNDYNDPTEETEEQRIDRRVEAAIKQREEIAEKKRMERETQELPQKLNQVYPDFNTVCTHENMDYLKFHYPEVAKAYEYLPDNFETWSTVYKAIKRFVPNTDHKQDAAKVEKNLAKPGSASSPGHTQSGITQPSARLTEERRAANWERMQRTLKGLN